MALAGSGGAKGALGRRYLGARGYGGGCVVDRRLGGDPVRRGPPPGARPLRCCARPAGLPVGRSPGDALVATAASPARTCATTCSSAA